MAYAWIRRGACLQVSAAESRRGARTSMAYAWIPRGAYLRVSAAERAEETRGCRLLARASNHRHRRAPRESTPWPRASRRPRSSRPALRHRDPRGRRPADGHRGTPRASKRPRSRCGPSPSGCPPRPRAHRPRRTERARPGRSPSGARALRSTRALHPRQHRTVATADRAGSSRARSRDCPQPSRHRTRSPRRKRSSRTPVPT